jgi:hypothetical protein
MVRRGRRFGGAERSIIVTARTSIVQCSEHHGIISLRPSGGVGTTLPMKRDTLDI